MAQPGVALGPITPDILQRGLHLFDQHTGAAAAATGAPQANQQNVLVPLIARSRAASVNIQAVINAAAAAVGAAAAGQAQANTNRNTGVLETLRLISEAFLTNVEECIALINTPAGVNAVANAARDAKLANAHIKYKLLFLIFKMICLKIQKKDFIKAGKNVAEKNAAAGDIRAQFTQVAGPIIAKDLDADWAVESGAIGGLEQQTQDMEQELAVAAQPPGGQGGPGGPGGQQQPPPAGGDAAAAAACDAALTARQLPASVPNTDGVMNALINSQNLALFTAGLTLKAGQVLTDDEKKTLMLFKRYIAAAPTIPTPTARKQSKQSQQGEKFTDLGEMIIAYGNPVKGGDLRFTPVLPDHIQFATGMFGRFTIKNTAGKPIVVIPGLKNRTAALTTEQYNTMVRFLTSVNTIMEQKVDANGVTTKLAGGRRHIKAKSKKATKRSPSKSKTKRRSTRRNRRS